jgi:hypothetical protein
VLCASSAARCVRRFESEHLNYAVPGNLNALGLFRDQVLRLWGKNLRRRESKEPVHVGSPRCACRTMASSS